MPASKVTGAIEQINAAGHAAIAWDDGSRSGGRLIVTQDSKGKTTLSIEVDRTPPR